MILTTTPGIEGKTIREYRGIVTGEAILGANIFKDFFAGIRDIVGGRSAAYEKELKRAREIALGEMEEAARQQGGNAVVGIDLDYEVVGGGSMLMVSVSGTGDRLTRIALCGVRLSMVTVGATAAGPQAVVWKYRPATSTSCIGCRDLL